MSTSNNNQDVQNAIDAMVQRYQQIEKWVEQLDADANAINQDGQQLATAYHHHTEHLSLIFGMTIKIQYTTHDAGHTNALKADILAKEADIKNILAEIQSAEGGLGVSFDDLIAQINGNLSDLNTFLAQNTGGDVKTGQRLGQEMQTIGSLVNVFGQEMALRAQQQVQASTSQPGSSNSDMNGDDVQDAMNAISAKYLQVQQWILQMQEDANWINQDGVDIKAAYHHHSSTFLWMHSTWTTHNAAYTDALNADVAARNADIKNLENQIKTSTGSSGFDDLFNSINAVLDGIGTAYADNSDAKSDAVGGEGQRLGDDLSKIASYLITLTQALSLKATQLEDVAKVSALTDSGDISSPLLQSLISQTMQDSLQEQTFLINFREAVLGGDLKDYNAQYNNADIQHNGIHWYSDFYEDGERIKAEDENIEKNATDMMKLITNLKYAMAPEIASLMPDFQEISALVNQIVKELSKILNGDLTPQEMQQDAMALAKQVMTLFVFIIGLLSQVTSAATKDKAQNEEAMSEASSDAAQMQIANSQAQAIKIQQDLEYADVMGTLMTVCKYTVMALATVAAPGIGSFLVGLMLIALEASGLMDKFTKYMADHGLGQIGADIMAGCIEMVATAGGGAALDAALKSVMKAVTEAVMTALATTVKTVVETAVKEVAEVAGEATAQAAKATIETTVKEGAEVAAKKTFALFFEQNGMALMGKLIFNKAAMMQLLESMMKTAAEDGAQAAGKAATQLTVLLEKEGAAFTAAEVKQFSELGYEVGTKAAANTMKASVKDAENLSLVDKSNWQNAKSRLRWTAAFALGANNTIVDTATAIHDKWGGISDDDFEKLKYALEALQQLLMIIGQMGGSGLAQNMMSDTTSLSRTLMKAANLLQVVPTTGQAVADEGQYEAGAAQSSATAYMMKIQMVLDILFQYTMPSIQNRRKQESQQDSDQLVREIESNNDVSSNLWKFMDSSSQALLA